MDKKFNTVVLGGTFDHLHKGHKDFMRFAFELSDKVIIGLTSDEYVKKVSSIKYQVSSIESYEERKANLENFLSKEKVADRVSIVQINDVYGITTSDRNIDALIVVKETLRGADEINNKRKELRLPPLEVIIAPSSVAQDGKVISSSRIREGKINREGKVYINPSWLKQKLFLPGNLREELGKPFGKFVNDDDFTNAGLVITVGDITTQKFNKLYLGQKISIIDYRVARKKKFEKTSDLGFFGNEKIVMVENLAGELNPELFSAITSAISAKERAVIEVLGEEDLAVLPAILVAPLGAEIYYGQPGKGIVKIKITEEIKEKAYSLVSKFITRGH